MSSVSTKCRYRVTVTQLKKKKLINARGLDILLFLSRGDLNNLSYEAHVTSMKYLFGHYDINDIINNNASRK